MRKNLAQVPSWGWYGLLFAGALVLPFMPFMGRSQNSVAVLAGIYIILGLSLNIIVGYAGLFQLGHAAFFGLGAYTAAILSINHEFPVLLTIPIAAAIAGVVALIISKPVIHLRGDYLCIVTIAFGEIFRIAAVNNIFGVTGGANGLFGIGRPEVLLPWVEPIPFITLVLIAGFYAFAARKQEPVVQWGGAAILAAGYYLPPLLTGQPPLYVLSILMGVVALGVGAALRGRDADTRTQLIGLAAVALVFAVIMLIGGEGLATTINEGVQENFKVAEESIEGPLGMTWVPVAFKRDARPYYYLVLIFIVITFVGVRRLQNSRLGRAWLYVREDELAAESMGIDTTNVKLTAFAIGSAWAGVAGVLYASRFTVISPENFDFLESVIIFCIVVLGGSGSIPGVLVGTLGMVVLPELLRDVELGGFNVIDWRDGLMGAAMVLMMVLRPAGLIPERRKGVVVSAVTDDETEPPAAAPDTKGDAHGVT